MTDNWGRPQRNSAFAHYERLAAEAGLNLRKYSKKLVALSAMLEQGEVARALSTGTLEGDIRERLLVLTDARVLFIKDDPWDSSSTDLTRIIDIKWRRGMVLGRLELRLSDGAIKVNSVDQTSGGLFATRLEDAKYASSHSGVSPSGDYEVIDAYRSSEAQLSPEERRRELMEKKRDLLLEEELEDEIEELEARRRARRLRRGGDVRQLPPGS